MTFIFRFTDSENQQKTKTGPTRLMDDSKRVRANKQRNAECPKATNKHRNDMANHPMCDALPFPGYVISHSLIHLKFRN